MPVETSKQFGEFDPYTQATPARLIIMRGRTPSSVNQVVENWLAPQGGYITDIIAGGTISNIDVLLVNKQEVSYMPYTQYLPFHHTFGTPIRFEKNQLFEITSLVATSGNHYCIVWGFYTEMPWQPTSLLPTRPPPEPPENVASTQPDYSTQQYQP
jgi:hypothetical protein